VWDEEAYNRCGGGNDNFGLDAGDVLVEVRPTPYTNPLLVVQSLREILQHAVVKYNNALKYKWRVATIHQAPDGELISMGGHIHFGFPRTNFSNGHLTREVRSICRILDTFVGSITILLEDNEDAKRRRTQCGYGRSGDYRIQDHGFEYRTPSSWLTSPYVAAGVLCLAKTVIHEIINRGLVNTPKTNIAPSLIDGADTLEIRKKLPLVWECIQQMELFSEYKPYLEFLLKLINNNKTWHTNNEILSEWGINTSMKLASVPRAKITDIWPESYFKTV
jgi:hypothetical protein